MVAFTWKSQRIIKQLTKLSPFLSGLGLVLLSSQPGWSHGAIATVTQTLSVEASYSSGQPMALAQVAVYSPENPNEAWVTGQTDEQGKFEFSPDSNGNWEVIIRQAGHGTTVNVPVQTQSGGIPVAADPTAGSSADPHTPASNTSAAIVSSSAPAATQLQRWASAGAAFWGLIGTVLFFSRGKNS